MEIIEVENACAIVVVIDIKKHTHAKLLPLSRSKYEHKN